MTPPILWRVKEAGFGIHEDGRPNVVAVRSASRRPGEFDDTIHVVRKIDGEWLDAVWPCTVDPGRPRMIDFAHTKGAARLAPGRHAFKIGKRSEAKGGYRCLVQASEVTVLRDADMDEEIDGDLRETGWFGIQVHHANKAGTSTVVGNWSWGCIVLPVSAVSFQRFMASIASGLLFDDEVVWVDVLEDGKVRL